MDPALAGPAPVAQATAPSTVDDFANGMGLIAMELDKTGARIAGRPIVGDFAPKSVDDFHQAREASLQSGNFPQVLGKYMSEVHARAATIKASASWPL